MVDTVVPDARARFFTDKKNVPPAGGGTPSVGVNEGKTFNAPPAPPPAGGAAQPMMPPRTPTPGTGYGDSWADVIPGTAGYGKPARPGAQSWFDWFSKSYNESPGDMATVVGDAASYHLAPLALRGVEALNQSGMKSATPIPTGVSSERLRQSIQEAYDRSGPRSIPYAMAGYGISPLIYEGIGPVALVGGGLASAVSHFLPEAVASRMASAILPKFLAKNVPEDIAPRMVQGGNISGSIAAGQEAGSKDSTPQSTAEAYAKNFPVGAGIDAFMNTLPMGRRSPADVTKLTQDALNQAGHRTTVPGKTLGFSINAGPYGPMSANPTLAELEHIKQVLLADQPKGYVPRGNFGASPEDPSYAAPTPAGASTEGLPGVSASEGNPELQQTVRPPSQVGGTINDILLRKINATLPEGMDAQYAKLKQQADAARQLQLMRSNAGLPGPLGDTRAQAAEQAQNFPPDTPLNTSWQTIARTPDQPPKAVSNRARGYLSGGGAALGEIGGSFFGYPHVGGTPGAIAGNEVANAAEWMFGGPKDPTGHLQAALDRQWLALTGYGVGPGGATAAARAAQFAWGPGQGDLDWLYKMLPQPGQ